MGGPDKIRFRFRSKSDDIDIMLEGTEKLVNSARSSIGMNGAMGFVREISTANGTSGKGNSQSEDGRISNIEESLPGPPPDPSRIPSVVRTVGELDLEGEISALGASKQTDPDISALEEFLSEVEPPEPLANVLSVDPMAEAWLQLVLTMVVREHGHTSLSISDINRLLGDRVNKGEVELKVFLDGLWKLGKLERIHGGAEDHYSPNPSWLESH
jgi:hypothetical protein|tara:strand:+ start:71 stop:712 length:642 start_codon:yes stop_codon:yes gene_type:complete